MALPVNAPSDKLYDEAFRPQFHYSAPHNWLNDPNGLIYYEGEYHLFYQYHPQSTVWGPMHWGHAVSLDLVHWETLPIALYPDEHGTIFSGAVVFDADNTSGLVPGGGLVALYSYHTQAQGVAFSTDRGRTWTKYAANPVISALKKDFRDPKVFRHDDQWVMVIAAGDTIMFLTSRDLLHWEIASEFTGGYRGAAWEVPDVFPMEIDGETKWVLIVSVNPTAPAGGGGTRYFIGSFDGKTFTDSYPEQTLWFDWGADNYAGTTYNDVSDNRRLFIAWMNNWAYAEIIPTSVWRGAMTVPRELRLVNTAEGIRLAQCPIQTLDSLRAPLGTWMNLPLDGTLSFDGLRERTLDIVVEFDLGDAETIGLELFATEAEAVRITYDLTGRRLVIQRPESGIRAFNPVFSAPLEPIQGRVHLRVLVDRSSVEVFANDGLLTMTSQVFPTVNPEGLRFFAGNGKARIVSLSAYRLESIWNA